MNSLFLFALAGLTAQAPQTSTTPPPWPTSKRILTYYPAWSASQRVITPGRNFTVDDIPFQYLSDINYAYFSYEKIAGTILYRLVSADPLLDFGTTGIPANESQLGSTSNFKKFLDYKRKYGFKFGVTIGGWSGSNLLSIAFRNVTHITSPMQQLLSAFPNLIDRFDIYWEVFSKDGRNYGRTGNIASTGDGTYLNNALKAMRSTLNTWRNGTFKNVEISVTIPSYNFSRQWVHHDFSSYDLYANSINFLTFDRAAGEFGDAKSAHQSAIYSASYENVASGFDADLNIIRQKRPTLVSKILIASPYHSRSFAGVQGVGMPNKGRVNGGSVSWEPGVYDYRQLPLPGAYENYNFDAMACESYDPSKNFFMSYDNQQAVRDKVNYVVSQGHRGLIGSDISRDKYTLVSGKLDWSNSLTKTMYDEFLVHG